MLAIISDLHITDGTTGQLLPTERWTCFANVCATCVAASWWRRQHAGRSTGSTSCCSAIRSTLWVRGALARFAVPPCDDHQSPPSSTPSPASLKKSSRRNVEAIRTLRALATEATVSLPPADGVRGQPVLEAEEMPVAICTLSMVGNRDWPLHLKGRSTISSATR
jgi:hypothetical protein